MLSDRLAQLRKEKDIIQEDLAKYLGITRPAYSAYESGKRTPDNTTLSRLADFFMVSTDYLLGRTDARNLITQTKSLTLIPIIGTIHAGLPVLAEENWDGEIKISAECAADFALRIKGDSMSWVGIHEGDLALMKKADTAVHGMIVAVGVEDVDWQATLKFYIKENGQPMLRAANPAYEDIKLNGKHRIIGQLVKVIKESPSLADYKEILISKEMADKGWSEAIEAGVKLGFDGKGLKQAVEVLGMIKMK